MLLTGKGGGVFLTSTTTLTMNSLGYTLLNTLFVAEEIFIFRHQRPHPVVPCLFCTEHCEPRRRSAMSRRGCGVGALSQNNSADVTRTLRPVLKSSTACR